MARPGNGEKRRAIFEAAVTLIAARGLGVPTAQIAKKAGVSNGTLFNYFATKDELVNNLYLELKNEMAAAALAGLPVDSSLRDQTHHLWSGWLHWATSCPDKRRALVHLEVATELTQISRQRAGQTMAAIAELLEKSHVHGSMREAPIALAVILMSAVAEATIDFIIRDPANGERHGLDGFEALWRIIA